MNSSNLFINAHIEFGNSDDFDSINKDKILQNKICKMKSLNELISTTCLHDIINIRCDDILILHIDNKKIKFKIIFKELKCDKNNICKCDSKLNSGTFTVVYKIQQIDNLDIKILRINGNYTNKNQNNVMLNFLDKSFENNIEFMQHSLLKTWKSQFKIFQ